MLAIVVVGAERSARLVAKLQMKDIPELPYYISVAQAAKMFGLSKVSMYYKIYTQRAFQNVFRIGGNPEDPAGSNERPFLLLLKSEVHEVLKAEIEAQNRVTPEQQLNDWNHR